MCAMEPVTKDNSLNPRLEAQALGRHVLLELRDCEQTLLVDAASLKGALVDAATQAGAHVVETVFHQFNPHGLSGVVVIAESHITVHTWPEHGYAAVDVFTCGDPDIAMHICDAVVKKFSPKKSTRHVVNRGPRLPLSAAIVSSDSGL